MDTSLFWADQKVQEMVDRESYHFLDRPVPEMDEYVVKTSASLSGVLHIGRLSDTIRADSIVSALRDGGTPTRLIWVAEDMDPFRKVPEGVPDDYERYLGMPVTDVPDPEGCHDSYARHHQSEYLDVIHQFVANEVEIFSTRDEYRKGTFRPFIEKIMRGKERVREILERYRDSELSERWSPWKPICSECGKIITPQVLRTEGTTVEYECRDYQFEKAVARGCGHRGEADATEDDGKLLWKGEWATEWARWKVSCEGGGKEYEVPTSAWWVNGEIVERVLDFPMPTPFFYEHLMIEGTKMSASLGNVVYPSQWLEVAPAELLRFLYNKKLMKTRSFSWSDLPRLYSDYDRHADVYYGITVPSNEKERHHMVRLYEISQIEPPPKRKPVSVEFSFASLIAQIYDPETQLEDAVEALRRSGVVGQDLDRADYRAIRQRLLFGQRWVEEHVPDQALTIAKEPDPGYVSTLKDEEIRAVEEVAGVIGGESDPESIQSGVFSAAKSEGLKPGKLFKILYVLILKRRSGPRFGPLVMALGPEEVKDILKRAASVSR